MTSRQAAEAGSQDGVVLVFFLSVTLPMICRMFYECFYAKCKTIVSNLQTIIAHLAVIDWRFETSMCKTIACDSKRHERLLGIRYCLLPITFRSISAGLKRPRGSRPKPTRPRPKPTRPRPRPRPQPTRPRPRPRPGFSASRPRPGLEA